MTEPVDLNALREQLKEQENVGVNTDGTLDTRDPQNDGSERGSTTLPPARFYR